ncbi:cbb3-type cytochrome oxidase assembly protein CcoS [Pseudochrobactrum sp. HB0163]|uniref:cbb3-type cytochrome oxidase assembly protein CcoS n=1 Tax=Pseudochrobactrum sp. HB0163 TaxID=3450708 RepID=UPI003F6DB553
MNILLFLIPIALLFGLLWLGVFLWSLKNGQYEDMDGAANRIFLTDDDKPAPDKPSQ